MRELTLALMGLFLITFYQNCSPVHDGEEGLAASAFVPPNATSSLDPFIAAQLTNDCLACHKGQGDFPASLKALTGEDIWKAGWVSENLPDTSPIILYMEATDSKIMPPASEGGAWAQTDINAVRTWIEGLDMGNDDGGGGGGGGGPNPTPTPTNVTYTADIAPIIAQHCTACHVDQALGGVDLSNYTGVRAQVNGTDPFTSPIYATTYLGIFDPADPVAMPRGNGGPISQTQLGLSEVWIRNGAPEN